MADLIKEELYGVATRSNAMVSLDSMENILLLEIILNNIHKYTDKSESFDF